LISPDAELTQTHLTRHERPDPRRPNLLDGCLTISLHPPPPEARNRRADHLHIKPLFAAAELDRKIT